MSGSVADRLREAASQMRQDADQWPGWVQTVADWLDQSASTAQPLDLADRALAVADAYLAAGPESAPPAPVLREGGGYE